MSHGSEHSPFLQVKEISEFADCLLEMHGVAHSIDIARLRRPAPCVCDVLRICPYRKGTSSRERRGSWSMW